MAKKMKSFLVTYHSTPTAMKKMQTATPEEMQAGMDAWMAWAKKSGKSLEDMGAPVMGGVNMKSKGPATPSRRKVSGYSKLKAENMAAAKRLCKGHPHLSWARGCELEIHEVIPLA